MQKIKTELETTRCYWFKLSVRFAKMIVNCSNAMSLQQLLVIKTKDVAGQKDSTERFGSKM